MNFEFVNHALVPDARVGELSTPGFDLHFEIKHVAPSKVSRASRARPATVRVFWRALFCHRFSTNNISASGRFRIHPSAIESGRGPPAGGAPDKASRRS